MDGAIGIVLSGGGARGAYEFGALEVLAPVLDEPPRLIVGTSAGGLGAAYLAANAHAGLEAAARSGGEQWLEVEIGDVIGPLCSPRELARLVAYGLQLLGVAAPAPPSLLDTSTTGNDRGADRLRAAGAQRRCRHARHGRRRGDRLRDGEERGLPPWR